MVDLFESGLWHLFLCLCCGTFDVFLLEPEFWWSLKPIETPNMRSLRGQQRCCELRFLHLHCRFPFKIVPRRVIFKCVFSSNVNTNEVFNRKHDFGVWSHVMSAFAPDAGAGEGAATTAVLCGPDLDWWRPYVVCALTSTAARINGLPVSSSLLAGTIRRNTKLHRQPLD